MAGFGVAGLSHTPYPPRGVFPRLTSPPPQASLPGEVAGVPALIRQAGRIVRLVAFRAVQASHVRSLVPVVRLRVALCWGACYQVCYQEPFPTVDRCRFGLAP